MVSLRYLALIRLSDDAKRHSLYKLWGVGLDNVTIKGEAWGWCNVYKDITENNAIMPIACIDITLLRYTC